MNKPSGDVNMGDLSFTYSGAEWIEAELRRYMAIIVDEILATVDDPVSIILGGGAARGEMSVRTVGRKVVPLNDLDVYVITEKPVPEILLRRASERALARLDLGVSDFSFYQTSHTMLDKFYIDLRNHTVRKLRHLPPLLKYLEIRDSGAILYGEDVRNLMPDLKVGDIPLVEGARFLLNRLCSFAEYFLPEYLSRPLETAERDTIVYFCGKCLLSVAEALTLMAGKYAPSYAERAHVLAETYCQEFPALHERLPDLPDRVEFFTRFKMNPDFDGFPGDPVETWFETRDCVWTVTEYYLEQLFHIKPDQDRLSYSQDMYRTIWKGYLDPYLRHALRTRRLGMLGPLLPMATPLAHLLLNMIYVARLRVHAGRFYPRPLLSWRAPDLKVYSALPLLLFSIDREGNVDTRMLEAAAHHLSRLYPIHEGDNPSYEDVQGVFGNAYRLYAHSGLV